MVLTLLKLIQKFQAHIEGKKSWIYALGGQKPEE